MSQQQLVPVNLYSAASDPTTPTISQGDMYYNTSTGVRIYNGSAWVAVGSPAGVTSITAGTGLTGGTITSTGTIAIDTTVTVDLSTAQSLSNKTISGSTNTLSNLNASNLTTGTVGTARLGTGTANNTTYLRGDGTWSTVSAAAATPTVSGTVFGITSSVNANTALGYQALNSVSSASSCVAIGFQTQFTNSTALRNVSVGGYSLYSSNVSGVAGNTAMGFYSGYSLSSGLNNTIIGYFAAATGTNDLTTGSNNIVIGNNAQTSSSTVSNTITLGNSSITTLRCQVTSITALSDARDKKDVIDLPVGLEFINKLRPVKFTWNMRQPAEPQLDADGNPIIVGKVDIFDAGFIAQELMAVEDEEGVANFLQLTYRDNPEKLETTQGRLIPVLVKAIQELTARIEQLENK